MEYSKLSQLHSFDLFGYVKTEVWKYMVDKAFNGKYVGVILPSSESHINN